jgi:hypothetical protein
MRVRLLVVDDCLETLAMYERVTKPYRLVGNPNLAGPPSATPT